MQDVSNKFRQTVYAPTRRAIAKVQFEVLDVDSYQDAQISVTSEAEISRTEQIINKVRSMSRRYATFERDYWRLDGTFHIPPRPNEGNRELGWWSDEICGADGVFSTPQVVEFTFSETHNSMGLTVHFDPAANEYAADFDIDVYAQDNSLIKHQEVRGNQSATYTMIHGLDNYSKIVITIYKWAKPYRRARVAEVDFGVVQEYEGERLINVKVIEELNLIDTQLPANEIVFIVDNSNNEFNILNPEGFYRFLQERQEVRLALGLEIADGVFELCHFMGYYLVEWQNDEGAMTTTFVARNIFELLENKEYKGPFSGTLYGLAEDMLIRAGVQNYHIDPALEDIETAGFPDKINIRDGLKLVAMAGKMVIFQDRSGVVNIKPFEVLNASTSYIHFAGPDMYAGMVIPTVDMGWDIRHITFDNVYDVPQIKLDQLVQTLVIVAYIDGESRELAFANPGVKEGVTLRIENPLIQSEQHAAEVAEWILAECNLRAIYTINWRQNPALEPGDIVLVEDSFRANRQSRIIKNEFEFSGALSGRTETKGGV